MPTVIPMHDPPRILCIAADFSFLSSLASFHPPPSLLLNFVSFRTTPNLSFRRSSFFPSFRQLSITYFFRWRLYMHPHSLPPHRPPVPLCRFPCLQSLYGFLRPFFSLWFLYSSTPSAVTFFFIVIFLYFRLPQISNKYVPSDRYSTIQCRLHPLFHSSYYFLTLVSQLSSPVSLPVLFLVPFFVQSFYAFYFSPYCL